MNNILVSIIIPCFNAVEYTKQCMESVLIHTNVNYELILINNGSTDGTKEYFEILFANRFCFPSPYRCLPASV